MALAVIVENSGFGAQAAAPIARRVLDYLLLGIYPSEEDIALVQQSRASAPVGAPRKAAEVPLPKGTDVVVLYQQNPRGDKVYSGGKKVADDLDIQHVAYRGIGPAIADILGHSPEMLMNTYAHVLPQSQTAVVDRISRRNT